MNNKLVYHFVQLGLTATAATVLVGCSSTYMPYHDPNLPHPKYPPMVLMSRPTYQAYPGPRLPQAQIAILEKNYTIEQLVIESVDGAWVPPEAGCIHLLPGKHEIVAHLGKNWQLHLDPFASSQLVSTCELQVEAAKNYEISLLTRQGKTETTVDFLPHGTKTTTRGPVYWSLQIVEKTPKK